MNDWVAGVFSAWTVVSAVVFLGVTVWVFVVRRAADFADAARTPLEPDDDDRIPETIKD
jgi:cbb3-type cytochrome oxidase subunit 3